MRTIHSLPRDCETAQRWLFTLGGVRGDSADFALAHGILVTPPSDKDECQHILILNGSKMKLRTEESTKSNVRSIRDKMVSLGKVGGEDGDRLTRRCDILQPVASRERDLWRKQGRVGRVVS